MALGLPQWLPLTDAEDMIATHLAAEVENLAEDELMGGGVCSMPGQPITASLNGNGRVPAPELELDLDCWQVKFELRKEDILTMMRKVDILAMMLYVASICHDIASLQSTG